jgi:hypothetical protein
MDAAVCAGPVLVSMISASVEGANANRTVSQVGAPITDVASPVRFAQMEPPVNGGPARRALVTTRSAEMTDVARTAANARRSRRTATTINARLLVSLTVRASSAETTAAEGYAAAVLETKTSASTGRAYANRAVHQTAVVMTDVDIHVVSAVPVTPVSATCACRAPVRIRSAETTDAETTAVSVQRSRRSASSVSAR